MVELLNIEDFEKRMQDSKEYDFKKIFAFNNEKQVLFKNYIGECEEEILSAINHQKDDYEKFINIIALMNSGKTYSKIDFFNRNGIKAIVIAPLQIIVTQTVDQYKKDCEKLGIACKVKAVHGNTAMPDGTNISVSSEEIKESILKQEVNVFVVVYNSIKKFFEIGDCFDPAEYILIIDEAHNLVTQYNFRKEIIDYLLDVQDLFKTVIYLSGTPELTLPFKHRTIRFKKNETSPIEACLNLVFYSTDNYKYPKLTGVYVLINLLLKNKTDKPICILIDNMAIIDRLKSAFIRAGIAENTIMVLHRDMRHHPDYHMLNEERVFPPHIKLVLTTRVIADGANIRTRMGNIYILDNRDYWMKRQFIARFREGYEQVFDIIMFNSGSNIASLAEEASKLIPDEHSKRIKELSAFEEELEFYRKSQMHSYINKFRRGHKTKEDFYYSERDRKFKISLPSIHYRYVEDYNNKLHNNPKYIQTYYKDVAGFVNIEIINKIDELYDEKTIKDKCNRFGISHLTESADIFKEYFHEFFWAFCSKEEPTLCYSSLLHNSLRLPDHERIDDLDDFWELIKNHDQSIKTMKYALDLAKNGFPAPIIKKILMKRIEDLNDSGKMSKFSDNYERLRWSISDYGYRNLNWVAEIERDSFIKEYGIVKFLHDFYMSDQIISEESEKRFIQLIDDLDIEPILGERNYKTILYDIIDSFAERGRTKINKKNVPKLNRYSFVSMRTHLCELGIAPGEMTFEDAYVAYTKIKRLLVEENQNEAFDEEEYRIMLTRIEEKLSKHARQN